MSKNVIKANLTGDYERIQCESCDEEFLFLFRDSQHEFVIGLNDMLKCFRFASEQGVLPPLPEEWEKALLDFKYDL